MEDQISFSQTHLDFLLSYGQVRSIKSLLITVGVIKKGNLPDDIANKANFVDLYKRPEEAFEGTPHSDVSIIIPPFGRTSVHQEIVLPSDVDIPQLAARKHIEDSWLLWGIASTNANGLVLAVTSEGMLNSASRQPIREYVVAQGLQTVILLGATFAESVINTALLVIRRGSNPHEILLVDASNLKEDWEWTSLSNALNNHTIEELDLNIWFTNIDTSESKVERFDPSFYHPRYLQIEPQEGYTEYVLSDIADIRGGRSLSSLKDVDSQGSPDIPFLQVSSITPEGKLLLNNVRYFPRTDKAPDKAGFAESGDILVTTAGSLGKCCIVPESLANGVYFDTSIRRLRVDTEVAEVASVYSFLRTEAAQLQIERYASGSVIPNISSANLGSIRIFLPEDSSDPTTPSSATSITQSIAQTLLDKVVYPLQKADADGDGWRDQVLEVLNNTIHIIQRNRRSLHDLVTQSYPLPIALAYRRMKRASHNPYEQRSRLIELYEALTHFFYCVLICDYLSNSELQSKYKPAEKHVRRAYENFTMEPRLAFISQLLDIVNRDNLQIRMMELVSLDLNSPLDFIRQVRNSEYHSASGTPTAQKVVVQEGWRHLEPLLRELAFLENYSLCRVDSFFSQKGQLRIRFEHFRGAMHETDIQEENAPIEDGKPKLVLADQDHVILLTPEYDWLDLHPFYQVISSEQYRYESHLCFVKQKKQGGFVGESVQFRAETKMPGYENLHQRAIAAGLIGP